MEALPTRIVTIVFTDIEGSSALWDRIGNTFHTVLHRHDDIIREALGQTDGIEVKHEGDGFMLAFDRPSSAVAFAFSAQAALSAEPWPTEVGELRVRMGIHTGEVTERCGPLGAPDFFGPAVNRAARISAAGHGGQVLLSATTLQLTPELPESASTKSMGQHRLRGMEQTEHLYQLLHPALPAHDFPPLRTLNEHPHNLPAQLSSFVGREEDLVRIRDILRDPMAPIISLVGPGGGGKTRLAIEAASELIHRFADGVWFVPLEDVTDADRGA